MATYWYGKAVQAILSKQVNLVSDDIKVALFSSSYTPNYDTDTGFSAIPGQSAGTGYTAGGISLANKTLTQDTSANVWKFDADDVTFPAISTTFRYAVIYNAANGQLVGCADFGSNQTTVNQDLTIRWETSGGSTGILEIAY